MLPRRKRIKLIVHTCVLLLFISGVCPGVTGRKPKIEPARSWKVIENGVFLIQEGDELRIECQGKGTLQFSTEKLTGNIQQSEFQTSKSPFSNSYTFIRPRTIKEDAGWYGCADESVEIKNDDQTTEHPGEDISWIYVYVNSSNPFAAVEELTIPLVQVIAGGKAVVPCRPTSPELPVEFFKNTLLEPVGGNITYDPKIGFIINYVDGANDQEPVYCKIAGNDELGPYYTLHVKVADRLSDNDVKTDELRRVTTGNNLTLHCNITFTTGIDVNMNWKTPNSIALQEERFHIGTPPSSKNDLRITRRKLLTIVNADKRDAGDYTCVVEGSLDPVRSLTRVEVFGPEEHFINLTVKGNTDIEQSEHETAKWEMKIDTHPNAKLDWYKDGTPIAYVGSSELSKYSHTSSGTIHSLQISRLNITDNGNYTFRVTTTKESKNITLRLTVKVKPVIVIHKRSIIHKPGETANFSCNATGSPIPNVTWSFSEWSPEGNGENNSLADFTKEPEHSGAFSVISHLNMPISSMGNLTCESCNTAGCTYATEPIFVSDGDGFFGIVRQGPEPVVEGDDIALICAASLYNYTNHIRWMFNNSTDPGSIDERIDVENVATNFTWQSILRIPDVKKSDAGSYSCKAETQAGKIDESKIHVVDVFDASEPSFNLTDMNNSDVRIDLVKHPKTFMNFTCRAQGMPRPEVTWRKDGEPLKYNKNGQYALAHNNSTLLIQFFTLGDSGNFSCTAVNRLGGVQRYVYIKIDAPSPRTSSYTSIWISSICVLIVVIIIVITYMGIKVHRERVLRKELLDAGLAHFEEGALECLNRDLTVDDQAELLPYDKKWEFPRELLKIGKQLGSGAFGVVMKAEARGIRVEEEVTTVAVKMVRRSADPSYMKALSSELKIMIHLGQHLNVVNLLGACTKTILTKRELYVIVEYCRYGNLHNYLQRHRTSFINQINPSAHKIDPNIGKELLLSSENAGSQNYKSGYGIPSSFSHNTSGTSSSSNSGTTSIYFRQGADSADINMSPDRGVLSNNSIQPGWRSNYKGDYNRNQTSKPVCTQDLLCWAWQVARGMEYLSSRNVLHGDLAARNILLADDNIVKICDFGLAKNMYKDDNYKKKGEGPLPIKWMAIESIRDRIFSTQSDVWSFGIVLWEFFTLARTPYPGMEAERQYDRLVEGYRMEKPEYATDEIYDSMLNCWDARPFLRPSFSELVEKIGALLNDGIKMHYFDLNTPYVNLNAKAMENGQNDYLAMMPAPSHDYHNTIARVSVLDPTSGYVPMSPLTRTGELGIFSPRQEVDQHHFDFPPSNENAPNASDSKNSIEAVEMSDNETKSPDQHPIDVQQEKVAPVNPGEEGASTVTNAAHPGDLDKQSFNHRNNAYQNLNQKGRKNSKEQLSPLRIGGDNNYTNLPSKKPSPPPEDEAGISFSNPSYVIMSALERNK